MLGPLLPVSLARRRGVGRAISVSVVLSITIKME
jgi:hypothetical protein